MYSLKNLEKIADNLVNGEANSLEGIQQKLITWFCFNFNTTPNDDRLLDMTLEELIVFYLMYRIKDDPSYTSHEEQDEYEEWLKEEMGENYNSEEDMMKAHEEEDKKEKQELEKIKSKYPDKITTDFENFQGE